MIALLLAASLSAWLPTVTAIQPVTLHPGVNMVSHFAPGGKDVMIVQAWRENGNAHSYNTWLVLAPGAERHP